MNYRFKCKTQNYKTIKFLEDNTGENLDDLGYGGDCLDNTPKAWSMKKKNQLSRLNYNWKHKFYERQCEDNEKISLRFRENICQIPRKIVVQYIQRTRKTKQ